MVKREWFDTPIIGWLMGMHGMIPVRRYEADLKALRLATQELKVGGMLGMFPEGTRSKGAGLAEGEPGTALLALRTGAPILPVAIWGSEHAKLPRDMFRRTAVWIRIGEPYTLPSTSRVTKQQIADGTREIMERIAEMLPENLRGVYGSKAPVHAGNEKDS
jgi:1-acyl-sn-glycerol-3-phosphate acyltransferase